MTIYYPPIHNERQHQYHANNDRHGAAVENYADGAIPFLYHPLSPMASLGFGAI